MTRWLNQRNVTKVEIIYESKKLVIKLPANLQTCVTFDAEGRSSTVLCRTDYYAFESRAQVTCCVHVSHTWTKCEPLMNAIKQGNNVKFELSDAKLMFQAFKYKWREILWCYFKLRWTQSGWPNWVWHKIRLWYEHGVKVFEIAN